MHLKLLPLVMLAMLLGLTGCLTRQGGVVIEPYPYQRKVIAGGPSDPETARIASFYPDPCFGCIRNESFNCFLNIWLEPRNKKPDFEKVAPGVTLECWLLPGQRQVRIERWYPTRLYGWQSAGFEVVTVVVGQVHWYWGYEQYGWYIIVYPQYLSGYP